MLALQMFLYFSSEYKVNGCANFRDNRKKQTKIRLNIHIPREMRIKIPSFARHRTEHCHYQPESKNATIINERESKVIKKIILSMI